MRDKIIKLLKEWHPKGGKFLRGRLADEILALIEPECVWCGGSGVFHEVEDAFPVECSCQKDSKQIDTLEGREVTHRPGGYTIEADDEKSEHRKFVEAVVENNQATAEANAVQRLGDEVV